MSGARSRKIWTVDEDALLRSLVGRYGEARGAQSKWKLVADKIPGRTTKDCRKRWFHSLDPNVRKGRWTAEEDQILKQAYRELGPAWHIIASMIRGRKDDQCAKRYNEILDPSASNRLRQWSAQEDEILCKGVHELGNQWSILAQRLPGRPPLTCRNRWRALSRYSSCSTTAASSPQRSGGATPQSEMTTPPNTLSTALGDDMNTAADLPEAVLSDPASMFSTPQELEGLDAWWESSFLPGASPWPDAAGAPDSPRRQSLPLPTPPARHSERLQNRKSEAALPVSPADEHSNTHVLPTPVMAEHTTPPPHTGSGHFGPSQRTVVVEFDSGNAAVTPPESFSTNSSTDDLSAMSFSNVMDGADTEQSAPEPPLLQLPCDDTTASPRQQPDLLAEQIAEMERSSQQMSGSSLAPNGAQQIIHHHHHHHHHHHYHHHHYYHDDRQATMGQ